MTETQKYLISLSRAAIFNEQPPIPEAGTDWQYIWDKASEQNITGLIASAVIRLPQDKQPENISGWKAMMMKTVLFMEQKNSESERAAAALVQDGLHPVCLKGMVVKELYPIPPLRTMGDFDMLIDTDERRKAEAVFERLGYTVHRDTLYTSVTKGQIHGEFFISLEGDFRIEPEKWNDELWKHLLNTENGTRVLDPTYEFAYSIVHTAKHLLWTGCGIRNIFDAVLLYRKNSEQIDMNTVFEICEAQHYDDALMYIISVAEKYFGLSFNIKKKRPDTDFFLEYLLMHGIFGKDFSDNILNTQVAKREGDNVSAFRRIFFPPRQMMWHKYQYLKKSALLMPVAWIHRFITAVFVRHYSLKQMISGVNSSISYSSEREKWLDMLGLK